MENMENVMYGETENYFIVLFDMCGTKCYALVDKETHTPFEIATLNDDIPIADMCKSNHIETEIPKYVYETIVEYFSNNNN